MLQSGQWPLRPYDPTVVLFYTQKLEPYDPPSLWFYTLKLKSYDPTPQKNKLSFILKFLPNMSLYSYTPYSEH